MGLLDRFLTRQPAPQLPDHDPEAPTCELPDAVDVVGESNYVDAIRAAVAPWAIAVLLPEPHNPYDKHAVGVYIKGAKVGHLSRDDARRYRPLIDATTRSHGYAAVVATFHGEEQPGVVLCEQNASPMTIPGIRRVLETAGFVACDGTNAGYGIKADGARYRVVWARSYGDERDEKATAMAKALREAGYSARLARQDGYPYASVTAHTPPG